MCCRRLNFFSPSTFAMPTAVLDTTAPSAATPPQNVARNLSANPYYYLQNFETVLTWVSERYGDLLLRSETAFIEHFASLPIASKALLVRMAMRKGDLFRASKLRYDEIGDTRTAVQCLIAHGWIESDPQLTLEQLFALLTKKELVQALELARGTAAKKAHMLEQAQAMFADGARRFSAWHPGSDDTVYVLRVADICERIKLMFFGNLHQDWSEFVLADLGIWRYEKVAFPRSARAFHSRRDIDTYLFLEACRERLHAEAPLEQLERELASAECENDWLQGRRAKLLFRIGQRHERLGDWANALRLYDLCNYPGARVRRIRVLEKDGQHDAAMRLAQLAEAEPESEAEQQQLLRIMPRLCRKLGQARTAVKQRLPAPRIDLRLARPVDGRSVEHAARDHLAQTEHGSCVYYVENTLINSLFGLLCWDAIFTAIPGAFFHPFQAGPADLYDPDFYARRALQFQACLSQLGSPRYKQAIRETYAQKMGIQSPFVAWDGLTEVLLNQALACLPADHLTHWFERLLRNIAANRAGAPDLIQFWPREQRYRMIEVKGPGDRLQDNQIRLLDFCMAHGMQVAVCYVQWEGMQ
jgi:hypothetical protein